MTLRKPEHAERVLAHQERQHALAPELDLPGFEPPPPAALVHVCVIGRLVQTAQVCMLDGGVARIEFLLRQAAPDHPHAHNILVRCTHPSSDLLELQRLAREHYHAGHDLIASGTGIDAYHSKRLGHVLRLLHVNHYARIDGAHAHERRAPTSLTPTGGQPHAQQPQPVSAGTDRGTADAVVF